jgi:hypothetical protein
MWQYEESLRLLTICWEMKFFPRTTSQKRAFLSRPVVVILHFQRVELVQNELKIRTEMINNVRSGKWSLFPISVCQTCGVSNLKMIHILAPLKWSWH